MMRTCAAAVFFAAASTAILLAAAPPAAARQPQNNLAAGWNEMDCNGHTHVVWGPTWLAPNHRMESIFIQDIDHDNYTPLKLTVNSISITDGKGNACGSASDFSFPGSAAMQTVGGTVSTAVRLLAAPCRGVRTYTINITCEHDGTCGSGTGVCPAIESHDLTVTAGGRRPAPKDPVNPVSQ